MNIKNLLDEQGFPRISDMAKFLKRDSGLPMNLYLYECHNNAKHSLGVKFQPNDTDDSGVSDGDYYTMSVCKDPQIIAKSHLPLKLKTKQIRVLQDWVLANYDLLWDLYTNGNTSLVSIAGRFVKPTK